MPLGFHLEGSPKDLSIVTPTNELIIDSHTDILLDNIVTRLKVYQVLSLRI